MRRRGRKRIAGVVGDLPAPVIAFDEVWTYRQARRRGQRQDLRVWTAMVEEADGSRWADFEIGDRSAETFLRLYERLRRPSCTARMVTGCTAGSRRIVMRWARVAR